MPDDSDGKTPVADYQSATQQITNLRYDAPAATVMSVLKLVATGSLACANL